MRCPAIVLPLLPLLIVPLAACPATAPARPAPPAASTPAPEAPAPMPPCLDLGDDPFAVAPMLERVTLDGDALRFCRREAAGDACYAANLESGALTTAPVPSDFGDAPDTSEPTPAPLRISADNRKAEVCDDHDRCRALKLPVRSAIITHASVSAGGRHAALTMAVGDAYLVQLYSLPTGKALKRITINADPYPCASADFLGDTLLVMQNICAGPAGNAWLADPTTAKRVAWVGGSPEFGAWSLWEEPVGDDLWAFREEAGREVVVQSVTDGRIVHRITLDDTLPRSDDGDVLADPSSGMMLRNKATGELVVVHDGPAQGTLVRIDPVAGRVVKIIAMPRCPR
ncbi:MAG: hypothetical protein CVU56_22285 [Deltaproteobacteria bacterium HGW-Deltaproteobacteria-14]|jgi:hypothetical protein|nr:MAG: hypothetical protein CVU56_22285 [Deltaproteobacteria bacterium HGW-Deltaproteobacteria-14]